MDTSPRPAANITVDRANLDDWRGLGELITFSADRLVAPVEGVHRAVADRWFGIGGPAVEPLRGVYNNLTASIYNATRLGASTAAASIAVGAGLVGRRHHPLRPIWNTSRASYIQSIVNALWGDKLEDEQSTLAIELGLRDAEGAYIAPDPESLDQAFPVPAGRLVVMLHGLGETERCWVQEDGQGLVELLESEGFSVLRLRYNTGRRVAANGIDLAEFLEEICKTWPVPVESIALVGHSMGGLVARSAVAKAQAFRHHWVERTQHLVTIGAPHLGTPIERVVQQAGQGLNRFSETRPIGAFIDGRSEGIKDLGYGPIIDGDRTGLIRQLFVAGAVTMEPGHPVSAVLGDLVVRVSSATGQGRHQQVPATDILVVGGKNHGALIRDPDVRLGIRNWLTTKSAARL
ncbi:MAG: GPI inositol-deacylase [Actinomycetia bacterium]|nr:GPI inositol-deacylase [Actinomycetes bacterium]